MFSLRKITFFMLMAALAVSTVFAQQRRELTVEESYLQQAMENMIIRETARSNSREQKLIALEYIEDAISRGNTSDIILQTLQFLSSEGRMNVAREEGRIINNFPDIRRRSAMFLGRLGTEEAANALIQVLRFENEPMVLQEAIKSLGNIGINNNNETIANIAWVVRHFDQTNPNNLMALAAIDAFERIADANDGLNSPEAIQLLIRISEGPYVRPVQERARQLLADLRSFN